MGATGAIGGYTVQMARSYCAHVIATVRGNADEAQGNVCKEPQSLDARRFAPGLQPDNVREGRRQRGEGRGDERKAHLAREELDNKERSG